MTVCSQTLYRVGQESGPLHLTVSIFKASVPICIIFGTILHCFVTNENEMALQWAEMRMVRWMCDVKLQDTVPTKGLRERLGLDDIISVLEQNRLQWYWCVLRKEENDWVKKCMEYEVEGARREIVEKDSDT